MQQMALLTQPRHTFHTSLYQHSKHMSDGVFKLHYVIQYSLVMHSCYHRSATVLDIVSAIDVDAVPYSSSNDM